MSARVKQLLKRNALLIRLNAAIKNLQLEYRSRRVAAAYQSRLKAGAPGVDADLADLIAARMTAGGTKPLSDLARPPGIFLVGTYYEQESAGFIQALEQAGTVVALKTAAGRYGVKPPAGAFDPAAIEENSRQIVEQITAARKTQPIDVLIGTMVAQSVSLAALQHVRSLGIPVLNIAMDDRLTDHWGRRGTTRLGAIGLAPAVDLTLQTTAEYIPRYRLDGHPVVHWPFGSDPDLFRPGAIKRYDVCFVGNNYGWRARLIAQLARAGIHVECFGSGFPNGHIDAARVAQVFGESKIVLGVGTVAHSRRIVTLKLRDFDGPMSGSVYMTTENPDLRSLFSVGEEIEMYRTAAECIQLVRHYLADDAAREAMGAAGRARALRDHTWRQRIAQAFGLLGWSAPVSTASPSHASSHQ
jgi:spore maturation protein CgeB